MMKMRRMWMGNGAHTGLTGEFATSKVLSQACVLLMEKVQLKLSLFGHGSFFRKFIGESRDGEWEAAQWRCFCFDENGNLIELTEDEIRNEDWIVPYLTLSRKSENRRA
jgi:hypothetical protein